MMRWASAMGLGSSDRSRSFELQERNPNAASGSYFRADSAKDDDTVSLTRPTNSKAKNNLRDYTEVLESGGGYTI